MSHQHPLSFYVVKRIIQIVPTIFGIIALTFLIIHLAPGDPIDIMVGPTGATGAYVEFLREEFALDRPLHEQFFAYIVQVLQGNLGYSFYHHMPVIDLIAQRAGYTILLMSFSAIFCTALGILLGAVAASKQHSLVDNSTTVVSLLGYSIPTFWLGQILLLVFALYLGLFPVGGIRSMRVDLVGLDAILDLLWHLVLPGVTLGIYYLAITTRLTRASMLEVLGHEFITFARSKGASEKTVVYKHALKNAMLPVITVIGINVGQMLTGAILTETVYSWPGLGRLLLNSLLVLDYPVLMGLFLITSISVIGICLVVDIAYAFLDPRVRYR